PLHLRWEHQFRVQPLQIPDGATCLRHDVLAQIASVVLFVQRARAIRPDFALTRENASTIGELCVRLDGLPLAIELAAAMTNAQTPQTILERLQHGAYAPGAMRDHPARHHSLHAAPDWSYDSLSTGAAPL